MSGKLFALHINVSLIQGISTQHENVNKRSEKNNRAQIKSFYNSVINLSAGDEGSFFQMTIFGCYIRMTILSFRT